MVQQCFFVVNGVKQTPISVTGSITQTGTSIKQIGQGQSNDYWFNGLIDDVRVYNRALSASEIQAMYNATK